MLVSQPEIYTYILFFRPHPWCSRITSGSGGYSWWCLGELCGIEPGLVQDKRPTHHTISPAHLVGGYLNSFIRIVREPNSLKLTKVQFLTLKSTCDKQMWYKQLTGKCHFKPQITLLTFHMLAFFFFGGKIKCRKAVISSMSVY